VIERDLSGRGSTIRDGNVIVHHCGGDPAAEHEPGAVT